MLAQSCLQLLTGLYCWNMVIHPSYVTFMYRFPKVRNFTALFEPRPFVMPNHFVDDESQELLGKFRVKMGFFGQGTQSGHLPFLPAGIGRRKGSLCLVITYGLRDPKTLCQHVNQSSIDIVD